MLRSLIAGAVASLAVGLGAYAQDVSVAFKSLAIGQPAPSLSSVKWIKGEAVGEFKKGQVYVLDFWATWCGPCVASIPHVSELQKNYKDKGVTVIGVAIWPKPGMKPTKDFVDGRGDKMAYTVVEDIDGKTAKAFMESMGQNGIPTAMVIDREGKLAWVGHPMDGLDGVVKGVLAGSYSPAKAMEEKKKKAEVEAEVQAKAEKLIGDFQTAQLNSDWEKSLKLADELIALDAERFGQAGVFKYMVVLTKIGDKARAAALGRELVGGVLAKQWEQLTTLAGVIAENEAIKDEDRDLDLALSAAEKANGLEESKKPEVLDTLARVHFRKKNVAEAVKAQMRAIELADDEDMKKDFRERLDEYQKAMKND